MFDHLFTLFHYSKLSPTICALGAARNSPALSRRKIAPLRPPHSVYLSYTNPRPLRPTNMGVLRNKSGLIFALMQSIKKFLFFPANFINFWDLQGPVETLSGRYLTPWRRPKTSRSSNHFSLDQHFANSGN